MHHGSCQGGGGGEKINMVLNIHYLRRSVGWEVPRGDFNYDEVVMFFSFLEHHCVIPAVVLALCNYTTATACNSSIWWNLTWTGLFFITAAMITWFVVSYLENSELSDSCSLKCQYYLFSSHICDRNFWDVDKTETLQDVIHFLIICRSKPIWLIEEIILPSNFLPVLLWCFCVSDVLSFSLLNFFFCLVRLFVYHSDKLPINVNEVWGNKLFVWPRSPLHPGRYAGVTSGLLTPLHTAFKVIPLELSSYPPPSILHLCLLFLFIALFPFPFLHRIINHLLFTPPSRILTSSHLPSHHN